MVVRIAWAVFFLGIALTYLTFGLLPPIVGYVGTALWLLAAVQLGLSQRIAEQAEKAAARTSPSEDDGIPLPDGTTPEVGAAVLVFKNGSWWRATVVDVHNDGALVAFEGYGPEDARVVPLADILLDRRRPSKPLRWDAPEKRQPSEDFTSPPPP